ncbi:hypothetical protein GF373_11685 [bacterium]|nr:hypothetical protein [bacterium]
MKTEGRMILVSVALCVAVAPVMAQDITSDLEAYWNFDAYEGGQVKVGDWSLYWPTAINSISRRWGIPPPFFPCDYSGKSMLRLLSSFYP